MFEVWTRDYPEETERVYANSDKSTCERWIQLHTLVHKEGYVIIETHGDSNQLCKDNILVKGHCYNNGWDIDHAGKNRFDYANKWSEYREIKIDQVAATDKELSDLENSVEGYILDVFKNGNFLIWPENYPGDFEWYYLLPISEIDDLYERMQFAEKQFEEVYYRLKDFTYNKVREAFERYFEQPDLTKKPCTMEV